MDTESRNIAVIAYIPLIGLVLAFLMNQKAKTELGAYHIRQSLGIILLYVLLVAAIKITGIGILSFLILGIGILWIIGLVDAFNSRMKPVPVFGTYFQEWFKNIS